MGEKSILDILKVVVGFDLSVAAVDNRGCGETLEGALL
jgi:hypothetical protein